MLRSINRHLAISPFIGQLLKAVAGKKTGNFEVTGDMKVTAVHRCKNNQVFFLFMSTVKRALFPSNNPPPAIPKHTRTVKT